MLHRLAKLCSRRSIATGANWQPKAKDRLAFGMGGAAITVAILAQGLNEVMRSRNLSFLQRSTPGTKSKHKSKKPTAP